MAKTPHTFSFMDMFAHFGRDLHLPRIEIDTILEHHRKNLEALEKSAGVAASGTSSVMSRQREMLREALREGTRMAHGWREPGNPRDLVARQGELARKSLETAVRNAGEVAEMVGKSGKESVGILRARIRYAVAEIRSGTNT